MLARRYGYRGPFDPQLIDDMENPYRSALLLETIKDGDPDEKRMLDFSKYLKSLLNVHGTAVINSNRRKVDCINGIFADDAKSDAKSGRVVRQVFTLADGTVVKVMANG